MDERRRLAKEIELAASPEHGLYRFMADDLHHMVSTTQYFYGVTVDRESRTAAWQSWLDRLTGQ